MVEQHFLSGRKHCIFEANLTPKGVNNLLKSTYFIDYFAKTMFMFERSK